MDSFEELYFNVEDCVNWENRLRTIAEDLQRQGASEDARMMLVAAAIFQSKAVELSKDLPKSNKIYTN